MKTRNAFTDPELLADYCRERFDCNLRKDIAKNLCERFAKLTCRYQTDDCCICWLLVQLRKSGTYPPFPTYNNSESLQFVTAVMHVFFLSLEETEEMIQILKRHEEVTARPPKRRRSEEVVARDPIDKTAWKVAGFPRKQPTA